MKLRNSGFSLVEVTIALGITAFAITSMMAVLHTGLGVLRDSVDSSVGTRILQAVGAEIRMSEGLEGLFYFDEMGRESSRAESVYTAEVTRSTDAPVPGGARTGIEKVSVLLARVPGGIRSPSEEPAVRSFVMWLD